MLKRLFTPEVFHEAVIASVLTTDVPQNIKVVPSTSLKFAVDDARSNPELLGMFVIQTCKNWAETLQSESDSSDISSNDTSMELIRSTSDSSYLSNLETAYNLFFKLCSKRTFEYSFSRFGSISLCESRSSGVTLRIARRGGVLGIMCPIRKRVQNGAINFGPSLKSYEEQNLFCSRSVAHRILNCLSDIVDDDDRLRLIY
jgi:hypothetical protein